MNIIVVGGGAAGLMAAVSAAEKYANVTILERNDQCGKKLILTGNGKCNFSNVLISPKDYSMNETEELWQVNRNFMPEEVRIYFEENGLLTTEKNGYLYPFCEQAVQVRDFLENRCRLLGVKFIKKSLVKEIVKNEEGFTVITETADLQSEMSYSAEKVILCCGGKALPQSGSDGFGYRLARNMGHTVTRTYPGLVQLCAKGDWVRKLSGVRCKARLNSYSNHCLIQTEYGELQFTDYGLSGIPIFQISRGVTRFVEEGIPCQIEIDLLPIIPEGSEVSFISERRKHYDGASFALFWKGCIHTKLLDYFLDNSKIERETKIETISDSILFDFIFQIRHFKVDIYQHNGFGNAQVTIGGVTRDEINATMESKLVKGLYFAGEMVDVDGRCGGYNLQWAWASGRTAGKDAAEIGGFCDTITTVKNKTNNK